MFILCGVFVQKGDIDIDQQFAIDKVCLLPGYKFFIWQFTQWLSVSDAYYCVKRFQVRIQMVYNTARYDTQYDSIWINYC